MTILFANCKFFLVSLNLNFILHALSRLVEQPRSSSSSYFDKWLVLPLVASIVILTSLLLTDF